MIELKETETGAAIREVLKRSVADPDFRALAERDGAAAIAKASGKSLPASMSVSFVSNAGKVAKSVVLPDPVSDADSLSEEELEQVAGGFTACGASSCATSG